MALKCHVIVLDGTTGKTVLVQASRQASLLRGRVDERVVQAADHLVRDTLEGPRTQANVF